MPSASRLRSLPSSLVVTTCGVLLLATPRATAQVHQDAAGSAGASARATVVSPIELRRLRLRADVVEALQETLGTRLIASGAFAAGLTQLFRRTPGTPQPGQVGAFPFSLAVDAQGTLLAVVYRVDGKGGCSELLRFDGGLSAAPTVLPLGCLGTYAKLQVASSGTYYLIDGGVGATLRLATSSDRGEHWTWHDIPLTGLPQNGDLRYVGYTPITPSCAVKAYDPDVLRLLFAGVDAAGGAQHSYFGELRLKP